MLTIIPKGYITPATPEDKDTHTSREFLSTEISTQMKTPMIIYLFKHLLMITRHSWKHSRIMWHSLRLCPKNCERHGDTAGGMCLRGNVSKSSRILQSIILIGHTRTLSSRLMCLMTGLYCVDLTGDIRIRFRAIGMQLTTAEYSTASENYMDVLARQMWELSGQLTELQGRLQQSRHKTRC